MRSYWCQLLLLLLLYCNILHFCCFFLSSKFRTLRKNTKSSKRKMNNNFDDVRITTLLNTKNERLFFSCFFFDVSMFCVFHVSALHRESIWLYIFTVLLCHSAYSLWICWALLFVIKMCGWFFYYFRVDCVVLLVWLLLVAFRVFSLHLIHSIHVWFINNVCVFVHTILDRVHALNSFILCPQYTVHTYTMMEKKKKKM